VVNSEVGGFLLRGALAFGVFWFVRLRHQLSVALALATPVALAALLSLYLAFDLVINPLA
jgi:hypothetical protein